MEYGIRSKEIPAVVPQVRDMRRERDGTGHIRKCHGFIGGGHEGQKAEAPSQSRGWLGPESVRQRGVDRENAVERLVGGRIGRIVGREWTDEHGRFGERERDGGCIGRIVEIQRDQPSDLRERLRSDKDADRTRVAVNTHLDAEVEGNP